MCVGYAHHIAAQGVWVVARSIDKIIKTSTKVVPTIGSNNLWKVHFEVLWCEAATRQRFRHHVTEDQAKFKLGDGTAVNFRRWALQQHYRGRQKIGGKMRVWLQEYKSVLWVHRLQSNNSIHCWAMLFFVCYHTGKPAIKTDKILLSLMTPTTSPETKLSFACWIIDLTENRLNCPYVVVMFICSITFILMQLWYERGRTFP